jgi:hypothetical protein
MVTWFPEHRAGYWWLIPVILATWEEAEIGRIKI